MALLIAAFLGGFLTLASPCVLPVLPFVLARSGRPFSREGLPLLLGLAFALAGALALPALRRAPPPVAEHPRLVPPGQVHSSGQSRHHPRDAAGHD